MLNGGAVCLALAAVLGRYHFRSSHGYLTRRFSRCRGMGNRLALWTSLSKVWHALTR